jgi:hypothetical protein
MQKKNNTKQPKTPKIDDELWQRILTSKQAQALAWKIDQARGTEGDGREVVKLLVEKWAEMVKAKAYFPDLKDLFTPDAVFCIEYAHKLRVGRPRYRDDADQVRDILTHISNLVARHNMPAAQLKHLYNRDVCGTQWKGATAPLPLFDIEGVEDGRKNPKLFIPEGVQQTKHEKQARTKRFRITGEYGNADYKGERIKEGDVCIVNTGAAYQTGNLVLVKCLCPVGDGNDLHYHAKRFKKLYGNKYSFCLSVHGRDGKRYFEGDEKIIVGPIVKVFRKDKAEPKAKGQLERKYRVGFDWPYFGIHKSDVLTIRDTGEIKVGQLAHIQHDEEPGERYYSRVCLIKDDTVRVCGYDDEPHDEPRSLILGVVVEIQHDDCNPTKIEALRHRLSQIDADDITDSTARFRLERQIYDLEHPPVSEEEEEEEWPEVIGDE